MSMKFNEIKRGQIYWINPNPYRGTGDHVQQSSRPGIIVSCDEINEKFWAFEIVYLTTAPKRDYPTNCTIRSSNRVSTALCDQVQTVSCEQIGHYIGSCTRQEMEAVERCIMTSLGLDIPATKSATEVVPDDGMVEQLKIELSKAQHEADLMKSLYKDLLERTLQEK